MHVLAGSNQTYSKNFPREVVPGRLSDEGLSSAHLVMVSWVGPPPCRMEGVQIVVLEGLVLSWVVLDVVLLHVGATLPPSDRSGISVEKLTFLEVVIELRL